MLIDQTSIHPCRERPVADTSKPWKGKGKLAKKWARLKKRQMAHAAMVKSLKVPTSYRVPGSMKK